MNFKEIVKPKIYGVPDIHPKIAKLPLKSAIKIDLGDEGKAKKNEGYPFWWLSNIQIQRPTTCPLWIK